MLPGFEPYCKPMGTFTLSKEEGGLGAIALNSFPSANLTALAVLAKKEPPIFKLALWPKIMPFGLRRNRLAVRSHHPLQKLGY